MIIAFVVFLLVDKHKSEKLIEKSTELNTKDSINMALHDTIKILRPTIEPMAYAIPTHRISHPGVTNMPKESPEFIYYLCLGVADSLKNKITKVDYFLDDPTFQQKHYVSVNPLDSFKVNYRGWGCLYNVRISIFKNDKSSDTLYFKMCDNLKLKGLEMAVH
jgi:hypothetical protein